MKSLNLPTAVSTALLTAVCLTPATHAEIVEIPAEEMTESYIRDTTVIVRKKAPTQQNERRSIIRVSPLDDDFSEGESISDSTVSLREEFESIPYDMTAQTEYEFANINQITPTTPEYDPDRFANEARLREVLGLDETTPIDYDNLSLSDVVYPNDIAPPSELAISPYSFEIVIPNSGNLSPESHSTPNGSFDINVTPDEIRFQVNTPR
ncbi:hypothetical protein [Thalassolituus maritimus]|uniref:Uncharacterized protein n=1 Tax=Thalassolituus maritimus TaxID=484498 RepID=A0ABP9ZZ95_9GAMM